MKNLHFSEVNGYRVLITGDVGSGKTALTARLLEEAAVTVGAKEITVIDMAPDRNQFKGFMVGGRLRDFVKSGHGLHFMVPVQKLHAPRIEGHSADEVLHLARKNAAIIGKLLEAYLLDPTPVLFANDVSIYLQTGDPKTLMKAVSAADTFVGNSYCGVTLEEDNQSGLSERERSGLLALRDVMDRILTISPSSIGVHNGIVKCQR